jgi:NAD(P)-dependent dehydrogenase (short-subunit alcohol dehydrogenase family)
MKHIRGGPMAGRTVLVTGATSGIGRATALGLATMGARIAVTGRDRGRTESAALEISAAGGRKVEVFVADLSSQAQVRRLASEVLERLPRIDVLINNAGGYWSSRHVTADGLERTFAVNHLAPFLLTNLLLDRLERSAPARVVTVASNAHATGRIDFDDLQGELSYSGGRAYSQIQARQRPVHLSAGQQDARERRHRKRAASRRSADIFRGRRSGAHPAIPRPAPATGHEVAGSGRRHVNPPGVSSRARAGVGPLLREPANHQIIHSQQRPGGRSTALGGERGSGRSHRGTRV